MKPKFHFTIPATFLSLFFLWSAPSPLFSAREVTCGVLQARIEHETGKIQLLDLPLRSTRVNAEISGFLSSVTVQQFFRNDLDHRIEAIYKFPLPDNAAVHDMVMRIGKRVIVGEVQEKKQARKTYEKAKEKGQTAALLEQERPNIFTQSVANIPAGEEIVIVIRYSQELAYEDGKYTFTFPMTVGPRFIPGIPAGSEGPGTSTDTDIVPDAGRITPPVLAPGLRPSDRIRLSLRLEPGFPLREVTSRNHRIETSWERDDRLTVALEPTDQIPNKDFILDYRVAGSELTTALLTHREEHEEEGTFLFIVQPPAEVVPEEAAPKEMIFVVDCSGSMSGYPMQAAKHTMHKFIEGMNPDDSFQIIRFSESSSALSPRPLPNTPENRRRGRDYVAQMRGMGGTMMIEGIKSSLSGYHDPSRMRVVFFLTDGYIGNEREIFSEIRRRVGDTRIVSVGIGSSPNRHLINGMAREGHGIPCFITLKDDYAAAADTLYKKINRPLLTHLSIDWGDLQVSDALPSSIPDLFDSRPLYLIGHYRGFGSGTILLTGKRGGREVVLPFEITLPKFNPDNHMLDTLWARRKIGELSRRSLDEKDPEAKNAIIDLAVRYHLASRYTSFVAVERELLADTSLALNTIILPTHLPEGVSYEGIFGASRITLERFKPGDPILYVNAPPEAESVLALFPFESLKLLKKDPASGLWTCRFLVPPGQRQGLYVIRIRIILPHGDWAETTVNYTIDSTPPQFRFEAEQVGDTLHFTAVPLSPVFDTSNRETGGVVLPDILSVLVRPPHGGYVVLSQNDTPEGPVWEGSYVLPAWYRSGTYTFRLMATDIARNIQVKEKKVSVQ